MEQQTIDALIIQLINRLKELEETVKQIQSRLAQTQDKPLTTVRPVKETDLQTASMTELMSLPDSLRKSMITIIELQEATPEEVSRETGRTRGLENIYLNQLERLGYITKTKKGKKVYFRSLRRA